MYNKYDMVIPYLHVHAKFTSTKLAIWSLIVKQYFHITVQGLASYGWDLNTFTYVIWICRQSKQYKWPTFSQLISVCHEGRSAPTVHTWCLHGKWPWPATPTVWCPARSSDQQESALSQTFAAGQWETVALVIVTQYPLWFLAALLETCIMDTCVYLIWLHLGMHRTSIQEMATFQ